MRNKGDSLDNVALCNDFSRYSHHFALALHHYFSHY